MKCTRCNSFHEMLDKFIDGSSLTQDEIHIANTQAEHCLARERRDATHDRLSDEIANSGDC